MLVHFQSDMGSRAAISQIKVSLVWNHFSRSSSDLLNRLSSFPANCRTVVTMPPKVYWHSFYTLFGRHITLIFFLSPLSLLSLVVAFTRRIRQTNFYSFYFFSVFSFLFLFFFCFFVLGKLISPFSSNELRRFLLTSDCGVNSHLVKAPSHFPAYLCTFGGICEYLIR